MIVDPGLSFQGTNPSTNGKKSFFQKVKYAFSNYKEKALQTLRDANHTLEDAKNLHTSMFHIQTRLLSEVEHFESFTKLSLSDIKALFRELEQEKARVATDRKELEVQKEAHAERLKELRQNEILITAKDSSVKKDLKDVRETRKVVEEKEKFIREETTRIEAIETNINQKEQALNLWKTALEEKETKLQEEQDRLDSLKEEAETFHEEAESIKDDLVEQLEKLKEEREEYKKAFEEKALEFERKLAELAKAKDIHKLFEKDKSKEGKSAKLVVQEAIRQMQKLSKDMLERAEKLEEQYCQGTFKGFAIPMDTITDRIEQLKTNLVLVQNYAAENTHLPLHGFLEGIQNRLLEAEKAITFWDFPTSYTQTVEGLALCNALEIFLKALNEWASAGSTDESTDSNTEPDFDYYEELGVNKDASQEEIKKAYRNLVKQFHPDCRPKNLSEEEIRKMDERWLRIQKAYETLSNKE
ncbi:MAG: DnaJ domain-containing protein [Leptospiraceae bacterium]|nr:DnaJ domain-containing protein [Leptospiraceae bacterium]